MAQLSNQLELDRCPHCNVDTPSLGMMWNTTTTNHAGDNKREWGIYKCTRCGGVVIAGSDRPNLRVTEIYPKVSSVDDSVPQRAKGYLAQALNSMHSPSGAVMLAASSVDAMLKTKGYVDGSLYSRIDKAAEDNLLTADMAKWAHQVRLGANDERHADDAASFPSGRDAKESIDFALGLAEYLFVLPSRVIKGLENTESNNDSGSTTS